MRERAVSIRYVLALTLFSMTGVRAGRVLLALYALYLGAQPVTVGVLAATFSVPPMLLSLLAGRFADRVGSRWPLIIGAAGGACGMLVPYLMPGMPALFVAAAMNGVAFTFVNVALQNLVGLLSSPSERPRNFSNFSLALAVASFIGPLMVGFSIDHAGYAYACLYVVAVSLVPVVLLIVKKMALAHAKPEAGATGSLLDALRRPGVWRVLATSSLVVTGIDMYQFYLPIYAHSIDLSASVTGVVLATFSAAAFVVRLIMPRLLKMWSVEKLLALSFYLGAASLVLVPLFQNAWVLALTSFMFGLGMGCCQPITMMLTFSGSAEGRSGEALGLRLTVNHLTRVISPVIFGSLGSIFGIFAVFWGNAALLGSGGVITGSRAAKRPPPT
ncbi:MAG: MFS transporter [Burkholderiales bacterium]